MVFFASSPFYEQILGCFGDFDRPDSFDSTSTTESAYGLITTRFTWSIAIFRRGFSTYLFIVKAMVNSEALR